MSFGFYIFSTVLFTLLAVTGYIFLMIRFFEWLETKERPMNRQHNESPDAPEPVADIHALKTWIVNNYGPIDNLNITNNIGPVETIISMLEEMTNNREAWREAYHDTFRDPKVIKWPLPPSHLGWEREKKQ